MPAAPIVVPVRAADLPDVVVVFRAVGGRLVPVEVRGALPTDQAAVFVERK